MEAFAAQALSTDLPQMTFWDLFMQAHIVVKAVMIGLVICSIFSWAIIFEKLFAYAKMRRSSEKFEALFWSGQSLDELFFALSKRNSVGMSAVFVAAMKEWRRANENPTKSFISLRQRLEKVMDLAITRESERLESRLTFLATVGSSSPFIGLFGTVWGIMTAFQAIAVSQNTSLAVVAPGIAEALLATAIGLIAAIPAVIAYNKLASDAGKLTASMEGFADEFATLLFRQIDERQAA